MASADICSSATTPLVYASTTQSICASDSACPSRLARMTSTAANSLISSWLALVHCSQRAPMPSGGSPSPAQDSPPSASTTTIRGVRTRPQPTAAPAVGKFGPSSSTPFSASPASELPAGPLPVAGPHLRAAGQIRVDEHRAAPAPLRQRGRHLGHRRGAGHLLDVLRPERVRQQFGHPQRPGHRLDQAVRRRRARRAVAGSGRTASAASRSRRRRRPPRAGRRRWRAAT